MKEPSHSVAAKVVTNFAHAAAEDKQRRKSSARTKFLAVVLFLFTLFGIFRLAMVGMDERGEVSWEEVFWSAWTTCASTALGGLPFFMFVSLPSEFMLGISNASAAGMMLAASGSLAWEGWQSRGVDTSPVEQLIWILAGLVGGVAAILATKPLLGIWGGAESVFEGLEAADARKAFLLCLVMFAHSMTEGVGIGVSFIAGDPHVREVDSAPGLKGSAGRAIGAGGTGLSLGRFVSLSLAIHNVPEGLATCLTLVPRGIPPLEASLWAMFTSISQPVLAVLAFAFVHTFGRLLAPGLGFAAGAMSWVACSELLPEALEQLGGRKRILLGVTCLAAILMVAMQTALR